MSESYDGNSKMGRVLSWPSEIEAIAGPKLSADTRESWLARAARRAGITFRQCRALYYGETSDPKVSVALSVITAAQAARQEALQLAARFESLAGGLSGSDHQNLYSEEILALIDAARLLRGVDRT